MNMTTSAISIPDNKLESSYIMGDVHEIRLKRDPELIKKFA